MRRESERQGANRGAARGFEEGNVPDFWAAGTASTSSLVIVWMFERVGVCGCQRGLNEKRESNDSIANDDEFEPNLIQTDLSRFSRDSLGVHSSR